jgi:hypothetical protein
VSNDFSICVGYKKGHYNSLFLSRIEIGNVLHETGHKLGLEHEHQRPDRELYIHIRTELITNLLELIQYIPKIPVLYNYKKYPYDYKSIMHYEENLPIIDGKGHTLGNDFISITDALKIKDIYK